VLFVSISKASQGDDESFLKKPYDFSSQSI
jgi:hypothetical protein